MKIVKLLLLVSAALVSSVTAATVTVNSTADPGDGVCNGAECTLREAVAAAASGDTINFAVAGTITLTSEVVIDKTLTIQGPAAPGIAISGNNTVRIFRIESGSFNLTFVALTLRDGFFSGSQFNGGGAISSESTGSLAINNCTLTNNSARGGSRGGAIYFRGTGSVLSITDSVVSGNSAITTDSSGGGGAIFNDSDGTITVTRSIVSGNTVSGAGDGARGGAIFTQSGAVTISASTFSDNSAFPPSGSDADARGGAVYGGQVGGGGVTISNSTFSGNSATARLDDSDADAGGGAVFVDEGVVTITNSTFTNNLARGYESGGGALFCEGATLEMSGSTISNNFAGGGYGGSYGGGMRLFGPSTITTSRFSANSVSVNAVPNDGRNTGVGGAVSVELNRATFSDTTFDGNFAAPSASLGTGSGFLLYGGGALYNYNTPVQLVRCTFTNNYVKNDSFNGGGAIFNEDGETTVANCTITGNSANSDLNDANAGGIYVLGGKMNVSDSILSRNTVNTLDDATGGGMIIDGDVAITNTVFSENALRSTGTDGDCNGGGLVVRGGTVRITNSTFADNVADSARDDSLGGGLFLDGGTVTITGTTMSGNIARSGAGAVLDDASGGAMAIFEATVTVVNSTFTGNSAISGSRNGEGGAVYVEGTDFASLELRHSTVARNSAVSASSNPGGGGLYNNGSPVIVSHTIIALNTTTRAGSPATATADLRGSFTSQGYNLVGITDGGSGFGSTGDLVGTASSPIDPRLGELGNYSGPTNTLPLLPGSPAINAGDPAFDATLLPTDQRGLPRVRQGRIDIGAYEAPPPPVITSPENGTRTGGRPVISGTAEPGSNVVVRISDGSNVVTVSTTADANGNWSVTSSALATGNYSVVAGAGVGNEANVPSSNTRSFVVDATPPAFSGVPGNMTVEATSRNGAVVTYAQPTANDNFDGPREVTCTPASGSTFALGTTIVTCTATDTVGNTGRASFNVTVQDTTPPTITVPNDIVVYNEAGKNGASVSFNVSANDTVDGAVTPTLSHPSGSLFPIGRTTVTVTASDSRGNTASRTFNVTVRATEMANISTRVPVGSRDNEAGIGGFIVQGSGLRRVVVRAIGPSLNVGGVPVPNRLENPTLQLFRGGSDEPIATNDDWQSSSRASEISAVGLAPGDARESAIMADLPQGDYTAVVRGAGGTSGNALVEVYAVITDSPAFLGNISTRGLVQTGDNVLIGGVIVRGGDPERLLFRAIGPDLANRGVTGALQDPTLALFDSNGQQIAFNDNWRENEQAIRETNRTPNDERESALVATLPSGNYTAVVRGRNDTTGVGLVEVFSLD